MHNTHAFGWVLLALVVLLGIGLGRSWDEGAASPRMLALGVALLAGIVAMVVDVWVSY